MDLHYPPADPRLTFDATLSNRLYRAYHRLFARAWNNDHVRQLVLTQTEMLTLLGCGRSTMYEHLNQLVSHALIAYYSEDDRFVITFKTSVQISGLNPDPQSRNLASVQISGLKPGQNGSRVQESRIPGQGETPPALNELIKTVVVVDPPQNDQLLLLGNESPETWTDAVQQWPVQEICDAAGIYPNRRPGLAKWPIFVAWLIYGYQHKAETRGEGIVSPALYAITRLEMHPAPIYLELANAGPLRVLDAMDDWYGARQSWSEVLTPAKRNGFNTLIKPYFPDDEDLDDEDEQE